MIFQLVFEPFDRPAGLHLQPGDRRGRLVGEFQQGGPQPLDGLDRRDAPDPVIVRP